MGGLRAAMKQQKRGTAMSKHGTASPVLIDGGYLEFQLAVLRALPRDLDFFQREYWRNNGRSLEILLQRALLTPESAIPVIVNCDVLATIPSDLSLSLKGPGAEHRKMGMVEIENRHDVLYANGRAVVCHLSMNQSHAMIDGTKLRQELNCRTLLNGCILDALLKKPAIIPEDWKQYETFFWGDVYCDRNGVLWVRGLYRTNDGWWNSCRQRVDEEWPPHRRAACLADAA